MTLWEKLEDVLGLLCILGVVAMFFAGMVMLS